MRWDETPTAEPGDLVGAILRAQRALEEQRRVVLAPPEAAEQLRAGLAGLPGVEVITSSLVSPGTVLLVPAGLLGGPLPG